MKWPFVLTILLATFLAKSQDVAGADGPIPSRPLTESCQPLDMMDELKLKFDKGAYWQMKLRILQQYKGGTLMFLRIAPIEMQREMQNLLADQRKDRMLVPEMYQGDLAQMTRELEQENMRATRDLWHMMIRDAKQDVLWADKCLSVANRQIAGS